MPDNKEALIAEYTATRETCRQSGDAQNTLFIFAFTSGGAILSLSLQQKNPYIAIINFIVLIAVRCRVMWFRDSIFNHIAYMRVILEPKLQLNSSIQRSVRSEGIAVIQYFIYTFIGAASVSTYLFYNPYNDLTLTICISLFIAVIFFDCYYFFGSNKLLTDLINRWTAVALILNQKPLEEIIKYSKLPVKKIKQLENLYQKSSAIKYEV